MLSDALQLLQHSLQAPLHSIRVNPGGELHQIQMFHIPGTKGLSEQVRRVLDLASLEEPGAQHHEGEAFDHGAAEGLLVLTLFRCQLSEQHELCAR